MSDTLPSLRKVLRVRSAPEDTFELFTLGIAEWWPVETHSLSGREGKVPLAVRFEPTSGGAILETRHDGVEAPWAEVTDWKPGRAFTLAWHVGRARQDATRITVEFRPVAAGGTEVILVHSGFEMLGPAGEAALANYDEGWDLVLKDRFHQACGG